ncbi:UPF0721 transmembrane protein [Novosphingobium indicum]|uniref:Probable membrane transporter protein n=1 Tax=Novosphingobium indicum TaxID=462949 RepID=A0ABQ2JGM4_9SPHN|nr:sulfite exporter TauE/SafE family protein [Novosphingobium indicum]GGN45022.1 UPF0721 transmembrane protein [Novosphingobium indicum]
MNLAYSVAGLLVGILVGLTGVGGGSLMAPILILFFGFNPAVAIGTDLWFAAITKSVGGLIHRRVGSPDWQVIRRLALGSVPAAVVTLVWLKVFHQGRLDADVLFILLGIALLLTAAVMPFKDKLRSPLIELRRKLGPSLRRRQFWCTVVSGAAVGALVTITSIGAGALVAVLLMMLYPLRLDTRTVVSTDILHAIPLALVAAIGQSWLGNVDMSLLAMLLLGSIPGIIIGSLIAGKIDERLIRYILAAMLAISGFKLLTA